MVLAVERLMGIEVPERAVWLRTALAELNRVLNHLMFLGSYPLEIGAITPVFYAFRERETLQAVMEEVVRRPDALHVQPGRRAEGGGAGRLDQAGPGRDRRGPPADARPGQPDPEATRSSSPVPSASAC